MASAYVRETWWGVYDKAALFPKVHYYQLSQLSFVNLEVILGFSHMKSVCIM